MPKIGIHPGMDSKAAALLAAWGWESDADAPVTVEPGSGGSLLLRIRGWANPDDQIFPPLSDRQEEFSARVTAILARRDRLARRLHDLRGALNAIQGYAEMLAETVSGEDARFASNICTAAETLTERLTRFRDEGV